jgi:type I restriction enzyme S subunit
MSFRRYTTTKPSSAPWIAMIPDHWNEKPLLAVSRERKTKNTGMKEDNLLSLSYGNIVRKDINTPTGLLPESFETYQIVETDDVVFRLTDLQNDKRSLRSAIVTERGMITSAYIAVRPDGIFPSFFSYLMRAYDVQKVFYSMGGGLRQSLGFDDLRRLLVVMPDIDEQAAIARFLDRETTQIDRLIEKKTRFIGLLKEKLIAFTDQCVTGRDDTRRALRSVDIPWAPMIPKEWAVKRGKQLFREMALPVESNDEIITVFRDGQVCLRSRRRTEGYTFAEKEVGYQHIARGDLVIHTMDAFAGAIGVSEDDGKATGEYAVCRPHSDEANPEYYAHLLRCMARRNYIYVLCPSVRERAPRFRFVRFAPVLLPVPPRAEQDMIVERIRVVSERLKALIAKTERSIELLKEKRTALITAAVTGKIDVRTAA